MQVDQRGTAAGVAHALHQLAQVRIGVSDQKIPGVTQVMEVDAEQAGSGERGRPCPGQ